ncbi:glutathione S-transferase family protein [Parasulfitobacter algicola]|uniref:Glutathione S-transferase family protein n=1 Tax=Parasulfitobacter algicola TaxID=2614809 RepID=A0ABX2IYT3_9RHOB|nr:glutathione S-transferase family protein [Sulfitobacter algicola]NSX55433.1 glutathione S-transferase family protein [Sulfitobacter algicola]
MTITISAFAWVPPFAQGYVKDIRARWALEEAGLPYELHLLRGDDQNSVDYRSWQPFGQVPAYRDDEVELFESGAIVLHIAAKSDALRPRDATEAASVQSWVFAGLNSIEPIKERYTLPDIFHAGEPWVDQARPHSEHLLDKRLKSLSNWLEDRDWLTGRFSVADIIMATVLRGIEDRPVFTQYTNLPQYLTRCLERPAFERALQAQMKTFAQNEPAPA